MFDFSRLPFFDNHTHLINVDHAHGTLLKGQVLKPTDISSQFLHGRRDVLPKMADEGAGISPELALHLENLGGVKTLVHYMAAYLGCAPTLAAVTEARNERTRENLQEYTKALYEDQNIAAEMVDDGAPMGGPLLACFPSKVLRLFQMDGPLNRLLRECDDYAALESRFLAEVRAAVAAGFIGVKCHVLEEVTCPPREVYAEEAQAAFQGAVAREQDAFNTVYLAVVTQLMLLCQELNVSIHIHSGSTGNPYDGQYERLNPFHMAPFLTNPKFFNTKVVFLHGSYPNTRNAALMAHSFPHVWVDLGWVLPWIALDFTQCLRDVLGVAPHTKVLLGSGQHGLPEFVWMSSKLAKASLATLMREYVEQGLLSIPQAQETAEMLLFRNAERLYGVKF